MATCRKVLVRRTIETTIRIERSVARPGNAWDSGGAGAPEGTSHFEPEATSAPEPEQTQETTTEIRLELSEAEAKDLMELFQQNTLACRSIGEALTAVLDGKDFATRRPKGLSYGVNWTASPAVVRDYVVEALDEATDKLTKLERTMPLSADGHHPNCSRSDRCAGEGTCRG